MAWPEREGRVMNLRDHYSRHCEECSDEAIYHSPCGTMDCFAALAMTNE
jgi:hypothetical protein